MKTTFFTTTFLCTAIACAAPSVSYPTADYKHDATKVSGLPSAGTLFVKDRPAHNVSFQTIPATPGQESRHTVVIDDPDGVKSIKLTKFEVTHPQNGKGEVSCSSPTPLKEGDRSHLLEVAVKGITETTILDYTLEINGLEFRIPLILLVK